MEEQFAVYAEPTPYGARQGWFAQHELTEIIRYRTEADARADLPAIANGFGPVGLRAAEVNQARGYARLVDEHGRLVALIEVAEIARAVRLNGIRRGAYGHLRAAGGADGETGR